MADQVLYSGVACITDLMVKEGLINLDFADVRAVMREMGKAMMGTGEADRRQARADHAAEAAIANPLIDEVSMKGARGLLISITGGNDLTLYEVDEAATRIREEVDQDANIIVGATFDESARRHRSACRWSPPASTRRRSAGPIPFSSPRARKRRPSPGRRLRGVSLRLSKRPRPPPSRRLRRSWARTKAPTQKSRCARFAETLAGAALRTRIDFARIGGPRCGAVHPPGGEADHRPDAHAEDRGLAADGAGPAARLPRRDGAFAAAGRDPPALALGEARRLRNQSAGRFGRPASRRGGADAGGKRTAAEAFPRRGSFRVWAARAAAPASAIRARAARPARTRAPRPVAAEEDQLEIPAFLRRQPGA